MNRCAVVLVAGFLIGGAAPAGAQEELAELGALIIGTWEAADGRHVHEWGVGRRLIRSRSYFLTDGEWALVSEGIWYWDDEEGVLRGTLLAVEMPVERFVYRTTIRGREVIHDLRAYGDSPGRFIETWIFDGSGYRWRLERPTDDGRERIMGGAYRRVGVGR